MSFGSNSYDKVIVASNYDRKRALLGGISDSREALPSHWTSGHWEAAHKLDARLWRAPVVGNKVHSIARRGKCCCHVSSTFESGKTKGVLKFLKCS